MRTINQPDDAPERSIRPAAWVGATALVLLAAALAGAVVRKAEADEVLARSRYEHESMTEARAVAGRVERQISTIHQGLASIGLLPGVDGIAADAASDAATGWALSELARHLHQLGAVREIHLTAAGGPAGTISFDLDDPVGPRRRTTGSEALAAI